MADTAGVSRSSISRQAIEGSAEQFASCGSAAGIRRSCWRSTSTASALARTTLSAPWAWIGKAQSTSGHRIGRDGECSRGEAFAHALARSRSADGPQYLFVIDGAKALRAGIEEVFGSEQPVSAAGITKCATCWMSCRANSSRRSSQPDARGMESDRRRRGRETPGTISPLSGARLRIGGPQPARGHGRNVHFSKSETSALAVQMPGDYQRHRKPSERGSEGTKCHALAYADMVERWVASAWLLTEKHFRKIMATGTSGLSRSSSAGKNTPRFPRKWRNMNLSAAPTCNCHRDIL